MNTLQKRKHSDYIHNPLLSSVQQQMKYVNFSAKTILIFAQFSVLKAETAARTVNSVLNHPIASHLSILSDDEIVNQAKKNYEDGAPRYSIVTSGKSLSDIEVDQMCNTIERIRKEVGISVCASFGLLSEHQYRKLKDAGVSRVHNNLETSPQYFPNICTTHTFQDKINAIKAARSVGLTVCSGGIMGLGETVEDRIDMALTLRELKIENIPINILNPVPGTPFENNKILSMCEVRRIIATYRFMIPRGEIRLSGGRGNMPDRGISCFTSGANAAISGQLLTTSGITLKSDLEVIEKLGYKMTCRQKNKLS